MGKVEGEAVTTEAEFWARVDGAPADAFVTTESIDWGGLSRGAGKRRGRMVMGAMSDPARGVKTYAKILGKADLGPEDRFEADSLELPQQALFARALSAGFGVDVAFLVAYTVGPDPITRSEAFEKAKENGYL